MYNDLVARAVIVAAGEARRFGGSIPKQFEMLAGEPLLAHGLRAISAVPCVVEAALVLPGAGGMEKYWGGSSLPLPALPIPVRRVAGARRRQDSVIAGLRAFSDSCDVALVHDAARPFPPVDAIAKLILKAREIGGAILAIPATDTIKKASTDGRVECTLERGSIWLAQTPQAFRGELLQPMIDLLQSDREFTDESAALEAMGVSVALVEGSPNNFKITALEDLERAEALLAHQARLA